MSTIREVSRLAGVSISTVSRVLNNTVPVAEDTRARVMSAVSQLGYTPNTFARGLVTNRSGGIGVVVNEISSPFYSGIVSGIEQVVEASGMHLVVSSGHVDGNLEQNAVTFLKERRCDALILHLESTSDEQLLSWSQGDAPTVIIGRYIPELAEACVYLDNELGGYLATKHLLEQGHRHIAHIGGPLTMKDGRDRLAGYQRALHEAGVDCDERLLVTSNFVESGGHDAMQVLLERGTPMTAVFAANDQMAAGALKTLREHNLDVPKDISLVGYDDVLIARYLYPSLTTVHQPLTEMGKAAATIALARLNNKETEVQHKFNPQLVKRESVRSI
ncbi:MAG: LacI family DNA-binding transcriptional regulator [Deinococcota bacterium]